MSITNGVPAQTTHPHVLKEYELGFDLPTQAVPRRHTVTSCLGLGPIPVSQVVSVHTLTDEASRTAIPRDGAKLTYNEAAVRSVPERAAQKWLDQRVSREIEDHIRAIKPLLAEINVLTGLIEQVATSPVRGANGETLTPAEAQNQHDQSRDEIADSLRKGSKKHLINVRSRAKEVGLLLIDYPVFVYVMMSIFNVNYRLVGTDAGTTIKAAMAAIFAAMGTLMLAVVARAMGRRHRAFKGDSTTIETDPKNRVRIRLELAGIVAVIATALLVMASRVVIDGLNAEVPPVLVYALAALFGLLVGFSAYLNYASEYDNGSDETDRVQHLSVQLRARTATCEGLENARKLRVEESGIKIARLNRSIEEAQATAAHRVTGSRQDKAIKLARSYHGLAGTEAGLPAPDLDYRRLNLVAQQARELTEHQKYLENLTQED